MNSKTIDKLTRKLRSLERDYKPNDIVKVKMQDISTLCLLAENVIPSIALLERRLERGERLAKQDGKWWIFDEDGEGITGGGSLRDILINLIWIDR
jgi:hypothetical protein